MINKSFEKTYFIDTNILLDDVEHIYTLSEKSNNLVIVCDIVLDELDSKKTLIDTAIGYQAREFNRFCENSIILQETNIDDIANIVIIEHDNIIIHLVSLLQYTTNSNNVDKSILNDRKIIECASKIKHYYNNFFVLSNDIAFRTRASLEKLNTQPFRTNNKQVAKDLDFMFTIETTDDVQLPLVFNELLNTYNFPKYITGFEFINTQSGKRIYGYKDDNLINAIDEELLLRQTIKPKNMRQKMLSSLIIANSYDLILCAAKAGSGKNLIVTSACCALMDDKRNKYEGITYIRATIDSIDQKEQELGFLPGDLESKMSPYLRPLEDTIEKMVRMKYKEAVSRNKEILEEKINEFKKKYNITFEAMNFLRGGSIENKLIIIDEASNISITGLRLILTRVGEGSKVFIIGDEDQIDSKYLHKLNNGLTTIINKSLEDDSLKIGCVKLTETIRSKIAGWAADNI